MMPELTNSEQEELLLRQIKEARGNFKDEHLITKELYRLDGTEKRNSLN